MARRPRILLLCRNPPTGRGSGARIRAGLFLRTLLARYEVHLLIVSPEFQAATDTVELFEACASVGVDPMDWSSRRQLQGFGADAGALPYLYGVLRAAPAAALPVTRAEAAALVARLPCRRFDAIVAVRLSMARLAQQLLDWGYLQAPHRVFDLDDIESRLVERGRRVAGPGIGRLASLGLHLERWRLRRVEDALIGRWDQVYVCSEADRALLTRRYRRGQVEVVGNTCATTASASPNLARPNQLLFVGLMSYQPNEDAVCYFCAAVLPRLIAELGTTPVTRIVGHRPSARVRALHGRQGVEVIGGVDDIGQAYQAASLVIAPIRFGGGTRIKIIEALAAGRPVVATTLGAEGLGLRDGVEIMLADGPAAFACACAAVLRDRALWDGLVRHGRAAYRARFAPEVVGDALLSAFAPLIGPAGRQ